MSSLNTQLIKNSLDPGMKGERMEKIEEAIKEYDTDFGLMDMETAYPALFELLWYSQLPCVDVKGIDSLPFSNSF